MVRGNFFSHGSFLKLWCVREPVCVVPWASGVFAVDSNLCNPLLLTALSFASYRVAHGVWERGCLAQVNSVPVVRMNVLLFFCEFSGGVRSAEHVPGV